MIILLGNMLFPQHPHLPWGQMPVFMAEDAGLCTRYRFHKHKLILYLAAMRHYRDWLRQQGISVLYWELSESGTDLPYEDKLLRSQQQVQAQTLHTYTLEDQGMRDRLHRLCQQHQLTLIIHESLLFLTSPAQFQDYRRQYKRLFMADFYKVQRRRLGILVNTDGTPQGGSWSYDDQNRQSLPAGIAVPPLPLPQPTPHVQAVSQLVEARFPAHPGHSHTFWLPVTREDALAWLSDFLNQRFAQFGPYEDALSTQEPFLFHSVLSPVLNLGLLTPQEVVDAALVYARDHPVPLNSLEGFIRQIIGWREYVRGVYHNLGAQLQGGNALNHTRHLTVDWYEGTTGLLPLDAVIQQVQQRGWAHHIERLMVVSNAMLLCEIHPDQVFEWFMALFVDSADWVMVPNVYGMGQFADGGLMMTKPYICGSNYLRKMGSYPHRDWCDCWDGLYWRFVDRHRDWVGSNPRLGMMVRTFERMKPERRSRLLQLAEDFISAKTT